MTTQLLVDADPRDVLDALKRVGDAAQNLALAASFHTATAVKAGAISRIAKRRPETYKHVIFQGKNRGWPGFVVLMDDVVPPDETARRRSLGMKRTAKAKYFQVRHTGLWLEFGTVKMRPKPWLFPAARAEESAHLNRLADMLQRAIAEGGF